MNTKALAFVGIGFELAVLIIAASYFGQQIDNYMGWNGYAMITFVILFFASWVIHLVVLMKKFMDDDDEPA